MLANIELMLDNVQIRTPILAQLIQTIFEHIQTLKFLPVPIKSSLFRTQADIHLTLQQYSQAMHAYISAISIETALFSSSLIGQQDDQIIKNMIKAALQLGKIHSDMIFFFLNNHRLTHFVKHGINNC